MHRIALALAAVALVVAPAAAQGPDAESAAIVRAVGLSAETPVALSTSKALPAARPLKVYVSTGLDAKSHDKFVDWIEKWNRSGDAKKYGRLEPVDSAASADVILARVIRMDEASTQHLGTMSGGTGLLLSAEAAPLYSYVLVRTDSGLEVVSRDRRLLNMKWPDMFADKLWDAFKDAMKRR